MLQVQTDGRERGKGTECEAGNFGSSMKNLITIDVFNHIECLQLCNLIYKVLCVLMHVHLHVLNVA